jgi:transcriptional regulator with XRE-family HTH domain
MDKIKFGEHLKTIRKNLHFTQKQVTGLTGVSQETLRRLEKGIEYASITTLSTLSDFYKIDLFKIISLSPESDDKFSSDVDKIALVLKSGNIESFKDEIRTLIEDIKDKNNFDSAHYIEYLSTLLDLELKTAKNADDSELILTNLYFSNNSKKSNYYITPFEITLNIYLAIVLRVNNNIKESLSVLETTRERTMHLPYAATENSHTFAVIAINISTAYHAMHNYDQAIEVINTLLNDNQMSFRLDDYFQLLFRKGISLYKMNNPTYQHVLKTAFYLISNETYHDLHDFYKAHILKTYNIILEVENEK